MTKNQTTAQKKALIENIEFGDNLKRARQVRNLTLDALSRLTKLVDPNGEGVSRVSLSRYENGTNAPGLRELKILSQSLKFPLSLFVYGDSQDPMCFVTPSLEDVISEIVMDVLVAQKVVKGNMSQDPESGEAYSVLLEKARNGT